MKIKRELFYKKRGISMKPVLTLILCFLMSCSGEVVKRSPTGEMDKVTQKSTFEGIKKKIVVLGISNETPIDEEKLGIETTKKLIFELEQSNRFIVNPHIEEKLGNSKEIYSSGGANLPQIANMAKNMGVYLLVYGRIIEAQVREKSNEIGVLSYTNMDTKAELEIRVFDVNTNREVLNERFKGTEDSSTFRKFVGEDDQNYKDFRGKNLTTSILKAVSEATPKIIALADRLNWQGRVAKVDGQSIYLNSGRLSGLKIGDTLSVVTAGNEIFDPQTGAEIGITRGIVKATVEIVDYFGEDGAMANLLSGGTIHEGDLVEIY